jgi:hypothetical protein
VAREPHGEERDAEDEDDRDVTLDIAEGEEGGVAESRKRSGTKSATATTIWKATTNPTNMASERRSLRRTCP